MEYNSTFEETKEGESYSLGIEVRSTEDRKSNSKFKKIFQTKWLEYDEFKEWLRPISYDNTKCRCIPCGTTLLAGKSELQRHRKSAKHQAAVNQNNSITSSTNSSSAIDSHRRNVHNAGIKLTKFCEESSFPLQTTDKIVPLIKNIFDDSKIASEIDVVKYELNEEHLEEFDENEETDDHDTTYVHSEEVEDNDPLNALEKNSIQQQHSEKFRKFPNEIEAFGEYIKSELFRIKNEEIRDEAEQEIITTLFKYIKKDRHFLNSM